MGQEIAYNIFDLFVPFEWYFILLDRVPTVHRYHLDWKWTMTTIVETCSWGREICNPNLAYCMDDKNEHYSGINMYSEYVVTKWTKWDNIIVIQDTKDYWGIEQQEWNLV